MNETGSEYVSSTERVYVGDAKTFLFIGALLGLIGEILALIPVINLVSIVLSPIATLLFIIGLLKWQRVDRAPLKYYVSNLILTYSAIGIIFVGIYYYEIIGLIAGLAVAIPLVLIALYFEYKMMKAFYMTTKEGTFELTANLIKWGVILLIVLIGTILLFVAEIVSVIAFSRIPEYVDVKKGNDSVS